MTGAAGGIGRAVVRRLGLDGHDVVATDLVAAEGVAITADLTDPDRVASLVAEAGPLRHVVCNAAYMTMSPFLDHDPVDWWQVVNTNLTATFRLIRAALPGLGHGSRVVVVASEWGVIGWPNATAYAASKSGLIALTKSLGRELAPHGISVNAIAPGVVDTPQLDVDAADAGLTPERMRAEYAEANPSGRIARPDEIAAAVSFLCGPGSGALVGQTLQINGGSTRCRV